MKNHNNNSTGLANKTLDQWLSYLESVHPSAIDMGLTRVKSVAESMGLHLDNSLLITVAGTNGKGTTCRLLEQALLAQGKSVAVYSSPHLIDYCERVRINGDLAKEDDFCRAFELIDKVRGTVSLTYFEFSTLAGMKMMQDWGVDVAILEVGLGGRLDATNILDPDLAVITTIDLDHQDWLGDSREDIAREKAGIMREQGNAVIGELSPPLSLANVVNSLNVNAVWAGKDFVTTLHDDSGQWEWRGIHTSFMELPYPHIPLQNVSTALAALETLDLLPDESTVKAIIAATRLPGRQQTINENPLVVVDVAHNPQATRAMKLWLSRFSTTRLRIVVGMLKDKSIEETLAPLSSLNAQWYVGSTTGARGCDASTLRQALVNENVKGSAICTFTEVASAYNQALTDYVEGELILVFGSFVTVAQVLEQHALSH